MPEDFLHYIWLYQLFDHSRLMSVQGERIQILSPGIHNKDSGPDFSHARIQIDGNTWVGNVEIHVKTGDWLVHQHQFDPAYSNVILHVVYKDNSPTNDEHLDSIPVLQLKGRIDLNRYLDWKKLLETDTWIPCESFIENVPSVVVNQMIHFASVTRLEQKVEKALLINERLNGHWEFTLMQCIVVSMGTKVNKEAFHALAAILPFHLIKKMENDESNMAALLFGISGFLEDDFNEVYPKMLKEKYLFLKRKHSLIQLNKSIWKFMRMRPMNFPSIRIAQLAVVLLNWTEIANSIFYQMDFINLEKHFRQEVNSYWKNHYRFKLPSKGSTLIMGEMMYEKILINALVPFLYCYGLEHDDSSYCKLTLDLLESLKSEKNTLLSRWKQVGIVANNAFESQGLLELKNNYCSVKKCLTCKIGIWILNSKKND